MKPAALTLLILLAACSVPPAGGASDSTSPPATTPEGSDATTSLAPPGTPPVGAGYETVSCEASPPVEFAVLCDVYDDVVDRYVDPVDPGALAAASVVGLEQALDQPEPAPRPERLRCAIPDPAFERLCDAVWQRLGEGGSDLDGLMEAAVRGMFRYGLDPFSTYIPDSSADYDPAGVVFEFGLTLGARDDGGQVCSPVGPECPLLVLSVHDFGPADQAGMVAGDRIVEIDGTLVDGLAGEEAAALLAGSPEDAVVVQIEREGTIGPRTLERQTFSLVPAELSAVGDIAVVRLNEFSQPAARDLGRILQMEEVESASGIVLDLRDNPGGLVIAAQAVASQFLDGGEVLVERGRDLEFALPVVDGGLAVGGPPMAVLVNRGTASAAEIVAAVLQERGRAVVVGEPTFGKNLVQEVTASRDGGQVRLTVARWETPGGLDIGYNGLSPDVVVPDVEVAGAEGDAELDAAVELLGG